MASRELGRYLTAGVPIWIDYTNWKGDRRWRKIIPLKLFWSESNKWHPRPQYIIHAIDDEGGGNHPAKDFALTGIHDVRMSDPSTLTGTVTVCRHELLSHACVYCLREENEKLRDMLRAMADRVTNQSELLSKAAERKVS